MAERKTALITGSYGGLGQCFVDIHAQRGGDFILVGRSEEKLVEQKKNIQEKYGSDFSIQIIAVDLSKAETEKC